jgi:hypothetical protein
MVAENSDELRLCGESLECGLVGKPIIGMSLEAYVTSCGKSAKLLSERCVLVEKLIPIICALQFIRGEASFTDGSTPSRPIFSEPVGFLDSCLR